MALKNHPRLLSWMVFHGCPLVLRVSLAEILHHDVILFIFVLCLHKHMGIWKRSEMK